MSPAALSPSGGRGSGLRGQAPPFNPGELHMGVNPRPERNACLSPTSSRIRELLGSWKWVIGYTALVLATLNLTPRFLGWLEQRNLGGLLGLFLFLAGIGCFALLLRHIYRTQGGFSPATGLRLGGFLGLYLCCMALSTDLTVDRVHFVEYGILGLLCFHAVGREHGRVRRAAYALVAVFAVGVLDEAIQGLLFRRYYALRDIAIDLMAGFLPIVGILWWPLSRGESGRRVEPIPSASKPGEAAPSRLVRAGDIWALLLTSLLVLFVLWVGRVSWDLEPLYGAWERENRCGRMERVRIGRGETILWEDAGGGRAMGLYRVRGNRLDGPLLEVEVLAGEGSDSCAWTTGEVRHRYFRVDPERLLFTKEQESPFRRGGP